MSAVAQTRRVDRGKGHSYLLDGEKVDAVTSVISNGVPKPALIEWAARVTREYAIDHWAELHKASTSERLKRLEKARWAEVNAASGRGTDIHKLALALAQGQEVEVPEPLEGHVDSYLKFTREWDPEEMFAETIVGNRRWRYMGTLDVIAKIAGKTWLIDFKTTKSGIFRESALQLAAYAHAEFRLDENDDEYPMPPIDRAAALWLRADGYDLIPCDISDETFRVFLYAQVVAAFQKADSAMYLGDALSPPVAA